MIFDEAGDLVWFHPLRAGVEATNLQVQQYDGQPVLTWWQGHIPPQGFGEGEELIVNQLLSRSSAACTRATATKPTSTTSTSRPRAQRCSRRSTRSTATSRRIGGPRAGAVTDSLFQEVDLRTGLVRREWHSLDHVGLSESYSSPEGASAQWPFDYLHVNSIDQEPDGRTLISARNTWALYELNTRSGEVLTRIGGRRSNVKLSANARTAFQHDATVLSNGTISLFDNGAVPKVHQQSRAVILAINAGARTDTVVNQYEHPKAPVGGQPGERPDAPQRRRCSSAGARSRTSPSSAPRGQLLFDAHMHGSYQSYRTLPLPMDGHASGRPGDRRDRGAAVARRRSTRAGTATPGRSPGACSRDPLRSSSTPVASAPRAGFETAIAHVRPGGVRSGSGARRLGCRARHLADDRALTGPPSLVPFPDLMSRGGLLGDGGRCSQERPT